MYTVTCWQICFVFCDDKKPLGSNMFYCVPCFSCIPPRCYGFTVRHFIILCKCINFILLMEISTIHLSVLQMQIANWLRFSIRMHQPVQTMYRCPDVALLPRANWLPRQFLAFLVITLLILSQRIQLNISRCHQRPRYTRSVISNVRIDTR